MRDCAVFVSTMLLPLRAGCLLTSSTVQPACMPSRPQAQFEESRERDTTRSGPVKVGHQGMPRQFLARLGPFSNQTDNQRISKLNMYQSWECASLNFTIYQLTEFKGLAFGDLRFFFYRLRDGSSTQRECYRDRRWLPFSIRDGKSWSQTGGCGPHSILASIIKIILTNGDSYFTSVYFPHSSDCHVSGTNI